jgi:hypothetical protein
MEYEILYWICFTGYILFFSNAVSMILSTHKKVEGHLSGGMAFITGVLTILFMVTSVITFISNLELKHQATIKQFPPIEQKYKIHAIDVTGDTIWQKVKDTSKPKPIEVHFDFNNYLKK